MKKVSIIVPVYNAQKYLEKCIDSVLNQTYKNIELLLINDGSKDDSIKIMNQYKNKDSRVVVIDKENEGAGKTRNLGISKATGYFLMFVDSDDYIDEDYIDNYVKNSKGYDVIIGGYKRVTTNKTIFIKRLIKSEWTKNVIVGILSKMYKRDLLIKNKINFTEIPLGEDVLFYKKVIALDPKINIINDIGYNWFDNQNSASNTLMSGFSEKVDIISLLENFKKTAHNNKYNNYFIKRFSIYYLLFSGKYATYLDFYDKYTLMYKWMKKEKILNNNIFPLSNKLKGESLSHRLVVLIFSLLDKIRLVKIFAKIYCKGEK